ncbi:MAG: hypothetical protein AB8C13_06560 [Phycisphaerales bacterium]
MTLSDPVQPDHNKASGSDNAPGQSDHTQSALLSEPPRKSPWSLKAKLIRTLWGVSELVFWKFSPAPMHSWRRAMLRFFGAKVGQSVRIHPSVKVVIPWNIQIGNNVIINERAILYALGQITIGESTEIGPLTHLCAGTHDYTDPKFTLLRKPITIGDHCILGASSFVAPDVTLARNTILHPRAAIYADTQPGAHYRGNPAKQVHITPDESSAEHTTQ